MISTNLKKRTNFSYGVQNGFKKIIKKIVFEIKSLF